MRNLLLLLLIGFAAYGGYTAWNNHRDAAPPVRVVEKKVEEPAPIPKVEPTPPPASPAPEPPKAEPPTPIAPAKRLAPEGVFYVVQAFSVTTDDGMRGIRAGSKVTLVKDAGAILRVSDGKQEFDARREFLTNDLDIAALAHTRQMGEQAANAEFQIKQQRMATMNDEQKADAAASSMNALQTNLAINNLRARDAALNQEAAGIKLTISQIQQGTKTAVHVPLQDGMVRLGRSTTHTSRLSEIPALESRLDTISNERASIGSQISALQR